MDIGYAYAAFRANWNARFIGDAKQAAFLPAATPEIPSRWYHDAQMSYAMTPQLEIYGGVNNIFDKQPPFFASGASGSNGLDTIPGYYDVFGRQGYVGLKLKL